jgi:hypothetical protein
MSGRMTYDELKQLAAKRHKAHLNQKSSRPLSEDYELLGLLGEEAFARAFGLTSRSLDILPNGDGRWDFAEAFMLTIDVKAAERPLNLLREVDKPHADILVLAGVNLEKRTVRLIGWEYDAVMVRCPSKDFGHGIINHYKRAEDLRPMAQLEQRLCRELRYAQAPLGEILTP